MKVGDHNVRKPSLQSESTGNLGVTFAFCFLFSYIFFLLFSPIVKKKKSLHVLKVQGFRQ